MRGAKTLALSALMLLIMHVDASAQTQREHAAELDQRARELFAQKDFRTAAETFEEANRLAPFAELRYNAALAWERAQESARAANAYESALQQGGLDADRENKARSSLVVLKERLAYVRIERPVGGVVSVAHVRRASIPFNTHLAPGEYTFVVERPDGSRVEKSVSVSAGEVTALSIEDVSKVPAPQPAPLAPSSKPDKPVPTKHASPSSSPSPWGYVLLGGAAAFGGAATYFGIQTQKARDDFDANGNTDADVRERGVRDRALTNVALGAAVVCAGAGVYVLVSGGSSTTARSAPNRVRLGLTAGGPSARWSF